MKRDRLVIRGRHYRDAKVIAGGLQLQRTRGQWVKDQFATAWRWVRLVWSVLFWAVLGCGGAEFQLGVDPAPDADPIVEAAASQIDAAPDMRVNLKPEAGVDAVIDVGPIEAAIEATPETAPLPEAAPEAEPPDACAAPAWTCRGVRVSSYNFCVIYLRPDGSPAGVMAEGNTAIGCPECGGGCACLSGKSICGYLGAGPLAHYTGCIERTPGQPEVTCQQ
jgi:hypothetical protein